MAEELPGDLNENRSHSSQEREVEAKKFLQAIFNLINTVDYLTFRQFPHRVMGKFFSAYYSLCNLVDEDFSSRDLSLAIGSMVSSNDVITSDGSVVSKKIATDFGIQRQNDNFDSLDWLPLFTPDVLNELDVIQINRLGVAFLKQLVEIKFPFATWFVDEAEQFIFFLEKLNSADPDNF